MIADGKAWPELFRRRPVRKAWKEARAGKGDERWEAVFDRIAWREGFEEHLRELARAATAEPREPSPQPDAAVLGDRPVRVVGDLPRVALGIDEAEL